MFQAYIHAVTDAEARVERLTRQIADLLPNWSLAPVVEAIQAMRGVAFIVAVTVAAEVGDFGRFDNSRQLMVNLGLTPLRAFQRSQCAARWDDKSRQQSGAPCSD